MTALTEYALRSQSGRTVLTYADEQRARLRMAEMAKRGTRLRLFKITHREQEMAA